MAQLLHGMGKGSGVQTLFQAAGKSCGVKQGGDTSETNSSHKVFVSCLKTPIPQEFHAQPGICILKVLLRSFQPKLTRSLLEKRSWKTPEMLGGKARSSSTEHGICQENSTPPSTDSPGATASHLTSRRSFLHKSFIGTPGANPPQAQGMCVRGSRWTLGFWEKLHQKKPIPAAQGSF